MLSDSVSSNNVFNTSALLTSGALALPSVTRGFSLFTFNGDFTELSDSRSVSRHALRIKNYQVTCG